MRDTKNWPFFLCFFGFYVHIIFDCFFQKNLSRFPKENLPTILQSSTTFWPRLALLTRSRSVKYAVEIKSISSILHYANKQLIGSSCEQKVYWKLPNVLRTLITTPPAPHFYWFFEIVKFFCYFSNGGLLSKEPDQHFFSKHLTTWQKHNFSTLLKTIW